MPLSPRKSILEVLLAGNITCVTKEFIDEAFHDDHVVVLRDSLALPCDPRVVCLDIKDSGILDTLSEGHDFDYVVFFSDYLSPRNNREGELDRLRLILLKCTSLDAKLVYVGGPNAIAEKDDPDALTGKGIIARAAEQLCFYYAAEKGFGLKVLRCPYLYAGCDEYISPFLADVFREASAGALTMGGSRESASSLLCADDLARLLPRIFESWSAESEILTVPDVFGHTAEEVAQAIVEATAELDANHVAYDQTRVNAPIADDHILRRRYGWYPRYDFIADVAALYACWKSRETERQQPFLKLIGALRSQRGILPFLEVALVWIIFEALEYLLSSSSQLNVIDYRVVFIVICATVYGLDLGIFAAVLACVGLTGTYFLTYGYTLQTLFYEPSNWLPFLAYLLVGAACGYVQLRNTEGIRFQKDENALLRDRNSFIEKLYQDTLEDKRMFRRQIVGRRDSFGKIYSITRELDEVNPREIYRKCCLIFKDILENDSVAIYHVTGQGSFARLAAACPGVAAYSPRSMPLDNMLEVLSAIDSEGLWANRSLKSGEPMYAYGVRRGEYLAVLIILREATPDQLTLYYENLFKILCGLTEASLVRAFEYLDAVKDARTEPGSPVLLRGPFLDELLGSFALREAKMSDHLLLRVDADGLIYADKVARALSCVRDSDAAGNIDGELYLLMAQAGEAELPIISRRFERCGLSVERVASEEEYALVSTRKAELAQDGGLIGPGEKGDNS